MIREFDRIDKRESKALQRYYVMDMSFFGLMSILTIVFYFVFDPSGIIYKLFEFGAQIVLK